MLASLMLAVAAVIVRQYDTQLFLAINSLHSPYTDPIWLFLTTLGNGYCLAIIAGALLALDKRAFIFAVLLVAISSLFVGGLKAAFPTLRPAGMMENAYVLGPLLRSGAFPSGHSASSMALALALIPYFRAPYWAIAVLIASGIGISRIFVGAHFPGDVLGGWVCALMFFAFARPVLLRRLNQNVEPTINLGSLGIRLLLALEIGLIIFGIFVWARFFSESFLFAEIILILLGATFLWLLKGDQLRS
jgi:undecaprenyl-diphosphatase